MVLKLESLFWKTHLETDQNVFLLALKLALWIPFGCTLVVVRLFGSLIFVSVLLLLMLSFPGYKLPLVVRRLLLLFIGIKIKIEGAEHVKEASKMDKNFIVTCNHRTAFDVLPFGEFAPLAVMLDGGFFDAHWLSRWFLKSVKHYLEPIRVEHYAGREEEARETQRLNIIRSLDRCGRPLFYFPEGWDTNGRGILRYQKFMFTLGKPVLPAALKVSVPFAPLRPGMLGSSIFREILWLFFSPYYYYQIQILPAITKGGETDIEFAARTQRLTALSLGVPATDYAKNDALTYRRSLLQKQPARKDE